MDQKNKEEMEKIEEINIIKEIMVKVSQELYFINFFHPCEIYEILLHSRQRRLQNAIKIINNQFSIEINANRFIHDIENVEKTTENLLKIINNICKEKHQEIMEKNVERPFLMMGVQNPIAPPRNTSHQSGIVIVTQSIIENLYLFYLKYTKGTNGHHQILIIDQSTESYEIHLFFNRMFNKNDKKEKIYQKYFVVILNSVSESCFNALRCINEQRDVIMKEMELFLFFQPPLVFDYLLDISGMREKEYIVDQPFSEHLMQNLTKNDDRINNKLDIYYSERPAYGKTELIYSNVMEKYNSKQIRPIQLHLSGKSEKRDIIQHLVSIDSSLTSLDSFHSFSNQPIHEYLHISISFFNLPEHEFENIINFNILLFQLILLKHLSSNQCPHIVKYSPRIPVVIEVTKVLENLPIHKFLANGGVHHKLFDRLEIKLSREIWSSEQMVGSYLYYLNNSTIHEDEILMQIHNTRDPIVLSPSQILNCLQNFFAQKNIPHLFEELDNWRKFHIFLHLLANKIRILAQFKPQMNKEQFIQFFNEVMEYTIYSLLSINKKIRQNPFNENLNSSMDEDSSQVFDLLFLPLKKYNIPNFQIYLPNFTVQRSPELIHGEKFNFQFESNHIFYTELSVIYHRFLSSLPVIVSDSEVLQTELNSINPFPPVPSIDKSFLLYYLFQIVSSNSSLSLPTTIPAPSKHHYFNTFHTISFPHPQYLSIFHVYEEIHQIIDNTYCFYNQYIQTHPNTPQQVPLIFIVFENINECEFMYELFDVIIHKRFHFDAQFPLNYQLSLKNKFICLSNIHLFATYNKVPSSSSLRSSASNYLQNIPEFLLDYFVLVDYNQYDSKNNLFNLQHPSGKFLSTEYENYAKSKITQLKLSPSILDIHSFCKLSNFLFEKICSNLCPATTALSSKFHPLLADFLFHFIFPSLSDTNTPSSAFGYPASSPSPSPSPSPSSSPSQQDQVKFIFELFPILLPTIHVSEFSYPRGSEYFVKKLLIHLHLSISCKILTILPTNIPFEFKELAKQIYTEANPVGDSLVLTFNPMDVLPHDPSAFISDLYRKLTSCKERNNNQFVNVLFLSNLSFNQIKYVRTAMDSFFFSSFTFPIIIASFSPLDSPSNMILYPSYPALPLDSSPLPPPAPSPHIIYQPSAIPSPFISPYPQSRPPIPAYHPPPPPPISFQASPIPIPVPIPSPSEYPPPPSVYQGYQPFLNPFPSTPTTVPSVPSWMSNPTPYPSNDQYIPPSPVIISPDMIPGFRPSNPIQPPPPVQNPLAFPLTTTPIPSPFQPQPTPGTSNSLPPSFLPNNNPLASPPLSSDTPLPEPVKTPNRTSSLPDGFDTPLPAPNSRTSSFEFASSPSPFHPFPTTPSTPLSSDPFKSTISSSPFPQHSKPPTFLDLGTSSNPTQPFPSQPQLQQPYQMPFSPIPSTHPQGTVLPMGVANPLASPPPPPTSQTPLPQPSQADHLMVDIDHKPEPNPIGSTLQSNDTLLHSVPSYFLQAPSNLAPSVVPPTQQPIQVDILGGINHAPSVDKHTLKEEKAKAEMKEWIKEVLRVVNKNPNEGEGEEDMEMEHTNHQEAPENGLKLVEITGITEEEIERKVESEMRKGGGRKKEEIIKQIKKETVGMMSMNIEMLLLNESYKQEDERKGGRSQRIRADKDLLSEDINERNKTSERIKKSEKGIYFTFSTANQVKTYMNTIASKTAGLTLIHLDEINAAGNTDNSITQNATGKIILHINLIKARNKNEENRKQEREMQGKLGNFLKKQQINKEEVIFIVSIDRMEEIHHFNETLHAVESELFPEGIRRRFLDYIGINASNNLALLFLNEFQRKEKEKEKGRNKKEEINLVDYVHKAIKTKPRRYVEIILKLLENQMEKYSLPENEERAKFNKKIMEENLRKGDCCLLKILFSKLENYFAKLKEKEGLEVKCGSYILFLQKIIHFYSQKSTINQKITFSQEKDEFRLENILNAHSTFNSFILFLLNPVFTMLFKQLNQFFELNSFLIILNQPIDSSMGKNGENEEWIYLFEYFFEIQYEKCKETFENQLAFTLKNLIQFNEFKNRNKNKKIQKNKINCKKNIERILLNIKKEKKEEEGSGVGEKDKGSVEGEEFIFYYLQNLQKYLNQLKFLKNNHDFQFYLLDEIKNRINDKNQKIQEIFNQQNSNFPLKNKYFGLIHYFNEKRYPGGMEDTTALAKQLKLVFIENFFPSSEYPADLIDFFVEILIYEHPDTQENILLFLQSFMENINRIKMLVELFLIHHFHPKPQESLPNLHIHFPSACDWNFHYFFNDTQRNFLKKLNLQQSKRPASRLSPENTIQIIQMLFPVPKMGENLHFLEELGVQTFDKEKATSEIHTIIKRVIKKQIGSLKRTESVDNPDEWKINALTLIGIAKYLLLMENDDQSSITSTEEQLNGIKYFKILNKLTDATRETLTSTRNEILNPQFFKCYDAYMKDRSVFPNPFYASPVLPSCTNLLPFLYDFLHFFQFIRAFPEHLIFHCFKLKFSFNLFFKLIFFDEDNIAQSVHCFQSLSEAWNSIVSLRSTEDMKKKDLFDFMEGNLNETSDFLASMLHLERVIELLIEQQNSIDFPETVKKKMIFSRKIISLKKNPCEKSQFLPFFHLNEMKNQAAFEYFQIPRKMPSDVDNLKHFALFPASGICDFPFLIKNNEKFLENFIQESLSADSNSHSLHKMKFETMYAKHRSIDEYFRSIELVTHFPFASVAPCFASFDIREKITFLFILYELQFHLFDCSFPFAEAGGDRILDLSPKKHPMVFARPASDSLPKPLVNPLVPLDKLLFLLKKISKFQLLIRGLKFRELYAFIEEIEYEIDLKECLPIISCKYKESFVEDELRNAADTVKKERAHIMAEIKPFCLRFILNSIAPPSLKLINISPQLNSFTDFLTGLDSIHLSQFCNFVTFIN